MDLSTGETVWFSVSTLILQVFLDSTSMKGTHRLASFDKRSIQIFWEHPHKKFHCIIMWMYIWEHFMNESHWLVSHILWVL